MPAFPVSRYNISHMWKLFRRQKTGLVLSGGGARGFFHVGVIKGLQKLNIHIDEIAGTSIGSVVGAMYAASPDSDIESIAKQVDFIKLLQIVRNPDQAKSYMQKFIPAEKFSDLKIKLKFNAADINNREEIVFDHGDLFPGLVASVSIPGLFPPVEYQNRYLVDGGVMDNIPASHIDGATRLIISDITGPIKKVDQKSMGIDILYSSIALMQQRLSMEKINHLQVKQIDYLSLHDNNISIIDFRKQNFQHLIDLGYQSVLAKFK